MRTLSIVLTVTGIVMLWPLLWPDHPAVAVLMIVVMIANTAVYWSESLRIDRKFYAKYPAEKPRFWPFP